jgi:hypothetical protein
MANTNFIVQNGLTVGPLSIDATTGSITTTGTIGGQLSGYLNGAIGANTANSGVFTSVTTTSAGQLTGYHTGAIGANTANTGVFTSVTTTSGGQLIGYLTGAIGANTANTGAFTTLTTTGTATVNSTSGVTAIANGGTTGVGHIGATGATFNTVFAKATTAQYADLAEFYAGDANYEPGTVVDFDGEMEVTMSTVDSSAKIAGVVSTHPAYNMNSAIEAEFPIAVALTGRVPTKVVGSIAKGQMLVSAGNGQARAETNPAIGTVIGKALENFDGEQGIIEVVIGKN